MRVTSGDNNNNPEILLIKAPTYCYQVKARPFVREFLAAANDLFELEVYTFGTRPYADAVVRFLDPDKRYFGERVVSRWAQSDTRLFLLC